MHSISIRAARIALLLLGAVAIVCLVFPPVYAIDFPGIPDGFNFVGALRPEDQVVQWLLALEVGAIAALASWLGSWIYQQRTLRRTPGRIPVWPSAVQPLGGHARGHSRPWSTARA